MAAISDGVLAGDILDHPVSFRALLPDGYAEAPKSFPVLYLLHGLFGSFENWTTLADMAEFAADRQMIVVMPEAGDCWYTDASGGDAYESFLISEFIPYIDENYRTVSERRGRGIAGLSMGGYGALKTAVKYPHLFSFAGSMSGVLDAATNTEQDAGPGWEDVGPSIMRVIGGSASETRKASDLFKIVGDHVRANRVDLPYLYFDCGTEDPYLPANRAFAELLSGTTVDHVYHELPGRHDWEYWNERCRHLLEIAECMLGGPRSMKGQANLVTG
jgi:S-formylglutathione hydrolase FrmB